MALDVFICGTCMTSFNDIEQFILHKNEQCGKPGPVDGTPVQLTMLENETATAVSSMTALNETLVGEDQHDINIEVIDDQGTLVSTSTNLPGAESLLDNRDLFQGDSQQTVIILQGDNQNLNIEGAGQLLAEVIQDPKAVETLTGSFKKKRGRTPGKSKKAEEKKPKFDLNEKNVPVKGDDGKLLCTRCKRSFTKERVFNAHKCLALSEYVDFSTKDMTNIDPDDNHLPQDDLDDEGAIEVGDEDKEFKVPASTLKKIESSESDSSMKDDNEVEKPKMKRGRKPKNKGALAYVEVDANPDIEDTKVSRESDQISNVPIFLDEKDRIAFEASLNIDISCVDEFFRIHCIEQELNQNVAANSRFTSNQLTLYSCNVCDKVFKSLSHMRFHALIHTDLKPFKCIKCDYTSNARGNLYTHMRKHTGQYYFCKKCKFKTVNKCHLIEHEMTHGNFKKQCELCKKTYNTQKSLMSHIRKYHDNPKGREYLSKFMQGRDIKGSTVIHQCHVCNRKFKKKMDRDRHLFVHDIKDLPTTQHCDLCDYTASRPKYLEKHFQKHRCIYRCCKCNQMFLSSVKLVEHITSHHFDTADNKAESWESLFEASIGNSLYLPEPDYVIPKEEKELINLPVELSESQLNRLNRLKNSGEDDDEQIIDSDVFINKVPAKIEGDDIAEDKENSINMQEDTPQIDIIGDSVELDSGENNSGDINKDNNEAPELEGMEVETRNIETDGEHPTNDIVESEEMVHSSRSAGNPDEPAHIIEETDLTEEELLSGRSPSMSVSKLIERLGFLPMTLEIFQKMRDTFGSEECEYCGRLFFSRVDYEPHVRTHTGTSNQLLSGLSPSMSVSKLIERLGFLPMTLEIFQKMRDTFGSEECEYCGRLFFSRVDYEPHVRTHTGDKPYACETCGYRAISREAIRKHVEREHENMSYPCKECSFIANSRSQLWSHSVKCRGLKGVECPECQELFESIKELKSHAALMHPHSNQEELDKLVSFKHKTQGKLGKRTYKCPHCDKTFFRNNSELQKHMWIHEGIKPFKCPICPHACRSKNNLQAHMLRHSKDKPFLCGDCGKAYKSRTALRWHVRSHAEGKLFKCDKCPYEATQKSHLTRHMETHAVIKRFICQHCDFSANTIGYLKVHHSKFHKDIGSFPAMGSVPVQISQPDVNVFKCLSCDYLFGNLSDLKRHLKKRHHVNVQEITQQDPTNGGMSEVQVLHLDDGQTPDAIPIEGLTDVTNVPQIVTANTNLDEKTANILQQLLDMSQNGSLPQEVQAGSVLQINPETIIVQQDGTDMVVSDNDMDGKQYVIQYIPQPDGTDQTISDVIEVQGEITPQEIEIQPDVDNS